MDYVCKENNKCIIDVSRRNQCQSCRLKKCLEVKMNKDGKYKILLSICFFFVCVCVSIFFKLNENLVVKNKIVFCHHQLVNR